MYTHLPEIVWESSEEHCLSDPISLLVPMLAPLPDLEGGNPDEGRVRLSFSQYPDGGRIRQSPSPQASIGNQSSQSSTGI